MLKAHPHNLPVWYSTQASRFVRQSPIHCSNAFTSKHCSVSPDCLLLQTVLRVLTRFARQREHSVGLPAPKASWLTFGHESHTSYQRLSNYLRSPWHHYVLQSLQRNSQVFRYLFRIFAVEVDSMSSFGLDSVKPDSSFASRRVEVVRAPWSFTVTWWNRSSYGVISWYVIYVIVCHSQIWKIWSNINY